MGNQWGGLCSCLHGCGGVISQVTSLFGLASWDQMKNLDDSRGEPLAAAHMIWPSRGNEIGRLEELIFLTGRLLLTWLTNSPMVLFHCHKSNIYFNVVEVKQFLAWDFQFGEQFPYTQRKRDPSVLKTSQTHMLKTQVFINQNTWLVGFIVKWKWFWERMRKFSNECIKCILFSA